MQCAILLPGSFLQPSTPFQIWNGACVGCPLHFAWLLAKNSAITSQQPPNKFTHCQKNRVLNLPVAAASQAPLPFTSWKVTVAQTRSRFVAQVTQLHIHAVPLQPSPFQVGHHLAFPRIRAPMRTGHLESSRRRRTHRLKMYISCSGHLRPPHQEW